MMNKQVYFKKAKIFSEFLPIISIAVLISGYIGYRTYLNFYLIPSQETNLLTIGSIGIFNITYILSLFLLSKSYILYPNYTILYFLYFFFLLFVSNTTIFYLIYLFLVFTYVIPNIRSTSFEKRRKIIENRKKERKYKYLNELLAGLTVLIISLFINGDFFIFFFVTYAIFLYFKKVTYRKLKINITNIIIVIFLPMFLMKLLINFGNTSIIGINKNNCEIITDKDTLNKLVVFSDDKFLYVHDQIKNETTGINKDKIIKINIKTNNLLQESGISFFSAQFYKLRDFINSKFYKPNANKK